jgi:hypothetical protein
MTTSVKGDLGLRLDRLERRNRWLLGALAISWTVIPMVGVAGLPAAQARSGVESKPLVVDHIVARKITVVDSKGQERVVIAAPLPEPRLVGRQSKRGDPVSGILLFDASGNERGGYVTGDGPWSSVSLTLDEIGRAAVSLWAGQRGEAGLSFNNNLGHQVILGVSPADGHVVINRNGKAVAALPAPATNPSEASR